MNEYNSRMNEPWAIFKLCFLREKKPACDGAISNPVTFSEGEEERPTCKAIGHIKIGQWANEGRGMPFCIIRRTLTMERDGRIYSNCKFPRLLFANVPSASTEVRDLWLLVDPVKSGGFVRDDLAVLEPQRDLLLGVLHAVGPVADIASDILTALINIDP